MFNNKSFMNLVAVKFKYILKTKKINRQTIYYVQENVYNIFTSYHILPFGMYLPYISNLNEAKNFFLKLRDSTKGFCRISIHPFDKNKAYYILFLKQLGFIEEKHYTHILSLEKTYRETYEKFNATRRNECNRNVENISIVEAISEEEYLEYYDVYLNSVTRWGLKTAIYKKEFIIGLYNIENVKLWLMKYDKKIISGMIVAYSKKEAFYWQGATLTNKEYKHLFSVVKLMNYVIKDLHHKNIKYLNMGASGDLIGVRKFKESFGADRYEYSVLEYQSYFYRLLIFFKKNIKDFILWILK